MVMKGIMIDLYYAFRRWFVNGIFNPVWYRFFGHKHHIVKTGLPPSSWYDADTRMLHAVMAIVEWYVENDMHIITPQIFDIECNRIKQSGSSDIDAQLLRWSEQYINDKEIIGIYMWWQMYPNRQQEISDALTTWHTYMQYFCKDKDDVLAFLKARDNMNDEQKANEKKLDDIVTDLQRKLEKEEQSMLKKAIDLRSSMWA